MFNVTLAYYITGFRNDAINLSYSNQLTLKCPFISNLRQIILYTLEHGNVNLILHCSFKLSYGSITYRIQSNKTVSVSAF